MQNFFSQDPRAETLLLKAVQRVSPSLFRWRRDLHQHPEPAWREFRTAALILTQLQEQGYSIHMGEQAVAGRLEPPSQVALNVARERALAEGADPLLVSRMGEGFTGIWADLVCGTPSDMLLAFRFDMDCNEVQENTNPEHRPRREGFASVHPGLMHACGHDGHVAVGMGLAEVLVALRDRLCGRIRLIFQPAEEGARGALPMIEAGVLEGVTHLLGFHIGFRAEHLDELVCGTCDFLASTKRDVLFSGLSSHAGAAPEEGRNALLAACTATLNLHAIARSGKGTTRINVGRLEGGDARNIIPSSAYLAIETRGASTELDAYMGTEAERILHAAAAMWGCTCTVKKLGSVCSGASDPDFAELVANVATEMGCYQRIRTLECFGATEDFSCLLTRVQESGGRATYLQIGAQRSAGHHCSGFDFDEACLPRALELLTRTACTISHLHTDSFRCPDAPDTSTCLNRETH